MAERKKRTTAGKAKTTAKMAGGSTQRKRVVRKATSNTATAKKVKAASGKGFTLRKEIKGLLVMVFAIIILLGIIGYPMGTVGEFMSKVFMYAFGLGAMIPVLFFGYMGWRMLYSENGLRITRRGVLFSSLFFLLVTIVPLVSVDAGHELDTNVLTTKGGIIGGALAAMLRSLVGDVGSLLLTVILLISCLLLITRLSLRKGLHKAKEHTEVGLDKAIGMAGETAQVVKERFEEWNEQRKSQHAVYNQVEDTRFGRSAAAEAILAASQTSSDAKEKAALELAQAEEEQHEEDSSKNNLYPDGNREFDSDSDREFDSDSDGIISSAEIERMPWETAIGEQGEEHTAEHEKYDLQVSAEEETVTANDWIEVDQNRLEDMEDCENKMDLHAESQTQAMAGGVSPMLPDISVRNAVENTSTLVPTMESTDADIAAVAVSTEGEQRPRRPERLYRFPSLEMLSKGKPSEVSAEEINQNVTTLESTLKSFGVTARVVNATKGPTVTRYELEPAPGTKVSKILNLTDDLKLSLAATDIRIEAPIPGKSAVGIEVPNRTVSPVHLRDVLESDDFKKAKGGIPVGLGKDIAGKAIITNLAKMPHLLVAGSTGSGKSVCVNTLIASILFSRKPEEVKLILVDPKMVELSNYNGIPHLMVPVVTDMKKAAAVLRWAVREMEARYRTLATVGLRNIDSYNEQHPDTAMPFILIIIDEMADLMLTAPDVEESINRLAAKARAAGIHMVLATQRPSVNVITGTIKANVPSRISFAVATQIDSRTILDMAGAEKLLGKGDMLFHPIGANKPIRIQGAFISDDEVESLVNFVKTQGEPEYDESVTAAEEEAVATTEEEKEEEPRDEYLERAIDLVMDSGQASVSMLQRRFRIGYTRAARLVDTMEDMKIIGPNNGSKARDILMSREQVKQLYFSNTNDNT